MYHLRLIALGKFLKDKTAPVVVNPGHVGYTMTRDINLQSKIAPREYPGDDEKPTLHAANRRRPEQSELKG